MPGAKKLKTSEYASAIIENMQAAVAAEIDFYADYLQAVTK